MPTAELPNRSLFKAPEVCEIAQLQPYVLRSWEAEFPDLGVTRAGTRVYRRGDVERVLRIKHLLFVEGLTLAGARRRLEEEREPLPDLDDLGGGEPAAGRGQAKADAVLRRQLSNVKQGLQWILDLLQKDAGAAAAFELRPQEARVPPTARTAAAAAGGGSKGKKAKRTHERRATRRR
jgi:DNA-binding transcriptional MerR regulator